MVFLGNLQLVENNKYKVGLIHYMPFDAKEGFGMSKEELNNIGILIDEFIEPMPKDGYYIETFVDINTKDVFFEEKEIPLTKEQSQIRVIEQSLANIEYGLMMGGLL